MTTKAAVGRPHAATSTVPLMPGLDGMRALAVMAVMVYHADNTWLPGGFIGVEVFFVISGYLITLLLIGEHERTGAISLRAFWARRARRLLPALYLMLSLLVIYTAIFRSDVLGQLRGDVIAALTYVSNWYQIWVGQSYTSSGDFAPLRHVWSLAVEEQFYLVWPLVMGWLLSRRSRDRVPDLSRWLLLAAVAITVVTGLLYHPGPQVSPTDTPEAYWHVFGRAISKTDTLYLSTPTRATGLLVGAALATLWRPLAVSHGPLRDKGRSLDGLAVIGLAALALLAWNLHIVTPDGADAALFRGGFLAVDLATVLVIVAVTHRYAWTGRLLGIRPLRWTGTRSYGLYLYHWVVYQIVRRVAGNSLTFPQFVAAVIVTGVLAEISYRLVEMPVRRRRVGSVLARVKRTRDPLVHRIIAFSAATFIAAFALAGVSMATARLQPNEIARSLDENAGLPGLLAATTTSSSSTTTSTSSSVPAANGGFPVPAVITAASASSEPTVPSTEPASTEPASTEPASTEPASTEPASTEPASTEPASTEPASTEPASTEPASTEPASTEPAPTEPASTEPASTEPASTEPASTEPSSTEPASTESASTEPASTEPASTEPASTEPASTEPAWSAAPAFIESVWTAPASTELSRTEPASTEPAWSAAPAFIESVWTAPASTQPSRTEPASTEPERTAPPTLTTTTTTTTTTPTTTTTSSTTTSTTTTSTSTTTTSTSTTTTSTSTTTTSTSTTTTLPAPTTTAGPTTTLPSPRNVQAIGDSVMLGAAEELQAHGVFVDAEVSRQMKAYLPTIQLAQAQGLLGDTIIVHLGTNGSFSNDTLSTFMDALRGVPRVVVLTSYADRGWVDDNNAKLMALPARYPNVTILDWHQLATQCPGDCFYDDGIHLNQNGQNYYASLVLAAGQVP